MFSVLKITANYIFIPHRTAPVIGLTVSRVRVTNIEYLSRNPLLSIFPVEYPPRNISGVFITNTIRHI